MQQIIDTHIHVWNFEKADYPWLSGNTSILNRTYHITEIEQERSLLQIKKGVLVQASNNLDDTNWMLTVAKNTPWISGVVGWLPLTDPIQTKQLLDETYGSNDFFKGVRHLIHDEADPKWLLQPRVIESLQLLADYDLSYDVVGVLPSHIETVLKVIELVPNLRLVFDHLNQPPIASKQMFGDWGTLMKAAALHHNCFVKLSGLGTATGDLEGWTASNIKPYIAHIIDCFGTSRMMCGGDWPVSLLAGSYTRTWEQYIEVANDLLNDVEREQIFYNTANNFYKL
jgi:L-fuconolactonase